MGALEARVSAMEQREKEMIAATEANKQDMVKLKRMITKVLEGEDASVSLATDAKGSPASASGQQVKGRPAEIPINLESPPSKQVSKGRPAEKTKFPPPKPSTLQQKVDVDLSEGEPSTVVVEDLAKPPPSELVVAPPTPLESQLAAKVVPEENTEAEEEEDPKAVADDVESKEEDSEEGDQPDPYVVSTGTPRKTKAKKAKADESSPQVS